MLKKSLIIASMVVMCMSGCGGGSGDDDKGNNYKPAVRDNGEEVKAALNNFRASDRRCGTENLSAVKPVEFGSGLGIIARDITKDFDSGKRTTATDYERRAVELYVRERTHNMYWVPKTVNVYSNTDSDTGKIVDMIKDAENDPLVCKKLMNPVLQFMGWDKTDKSEVLILTADDGI